MQKINEIEIMLLDKNIDYLGITEANLRKDTNLKKVDVPGCKMVCDTRAGK